MLYKKSTAAFVTSIGKHRVTNIGKELNIHKLHELTKKIIETKFFLFSKLKPLKLKFYC